MMREILEKSWKYEQMGKPIGIVQVFDYDQALSAIKEEILGKLPIYKRDWEDEPAGDRKSVV